MKSILALLLGCCLALATGSAPGQEPKPPAPAETPAVEDAENVPEQAEPADIQAVLEELADLRAEVLRLQQTMDTYLSGLLTSLKAENEALRRELRETYREMRKTLPAVPTPNRQLLEEVLNEEGLAEAPEEYVSRPEEAPGEFEETSPAEPPAPAKPLDPAIASAITDTGYYVVAEWGRPPEDNAAEPKVPSLKGMVCLAKPGATDDELRALGTRLRAQFDAYDNINIEVFDDLDAAEAAKHGATPVPGHRVLSISRFAGSGRDVILLIRGDKTTEIPWKEPPAAEP